MHVKKSSISKSLYALLHRRSPNNVRKGGQNLRLVRADSSHRAICLLLVRFLSRKPSAFLSLFPLFPFPSLSLVLHKVFSPSQSFQNTNHLHPALHCLPITAAVPFYTGTNLEIAGQKRLQATLFIHLGTVARLALEYFHAFFRNNFPTLSRLR